MVQIVTLTMNPALDKSMTVKTVTPDRKLRCNAPQWEPGGGGINVARVVGRLGGRAVAIYPQGGAHGKMFRRLLEAEGVSQRPFLISGNTRESVAVRETSTDQQYRFSVPGPTLSQSESKKAHDLLTDLDTTPDYLVLSGGLPPGVPDDFYGEVAARAHARGTRVIVDSSGAPLREAIAAGVYLIKPNLRELRQLMEEPLNDEQTQQQAALSLVEDGRCEAVVLSLGAAGAMLTTAQGSEHLRAPTVTIRSKVGAGDSMVGGLVYRLAEGDDIYTATCFGIAAGAAAVKSPGTELCRPEDVEKLFANMT